MSLLAKCCASMSPTCKNACRLLSGRAWSELMRRMVSPHAALWCTVEFGLIATPHGLRIFGAGMVSSKGQSLHSLQSPAPNRIGFDLQRIMRTRYRIDSFQKTYFVIDSFAQLMRATAPDFTPIYADLVQQTQVPAGDVLATDRVIQRGSGEGRSRGGGM